MPVLLLDRPIPDVDDAATRREFIVGGLSLAVLGACSGDDDDAAAGPGSSVSASASEPSTGSTPPSTPTPERVVVDWVTFDHLVAIGFDLDVVVGVFNLGDFQDDPTLSPYLTKAAADAGVADVGTGREPNLEQMLTLRPDLILAAEDQLQDADARTQMDDIAALVAYDIAEGTWSFVDWKASLRSATTQLGGDWPAKAEDYIAAFEAKVAAFTADFADVIANTTVTLGSVYEDRARLSFAGANVGAEVMSELGLSRPDAQLALDVDDYGGVELSPEQFQLLDADVIFLEQRQDEITFLQSNPLWQNLPAVQHQRVVFVPNYWEFGGAGSAGHVLDELIATLTAV